jgi:hypothetical protein
MKKIILLFITLFAFSFVKAQDSKAYLGVSVGYAIPGGDGSENVNSGINLGFINFGYRFSKAWGATLNLTSSGFSYKNSANGSAVGIAAFSVGPMYTASLGKKLSLDLKPQYAFRVTGVQKNIPIQNMMYDATYKGTGFVLGSSLNFGVSKGFKLSFNLDYASFNFTEVEVAGTTASVSTSANQLVLGAGLRYNF